MTRNDEKLSYPKSVFFILSQEFCERFSYYGMRAVLSLYLLTYLNNDVNLATIIFHIFAMLCYFTPVFGSILADGFIGKFRTIFYLSIVYALGNAILSLASTESTIGLSASHVLPISLVGLLLICIGTGGIKPCVAAFGGDQFVLPQQEKYLLTFFSVFYFCINAGSLVSTLITPVFRKTISCLGKETCYPLAFGVPAALMVSSLIVFLFGKPFYKIIPPEGNLLVKVFHCMKHAISQKSRSSSKREHWLDHADDKYDKSLIDDIKILLRVLVLYIPLPVFWALYDQQGSTWTFQAYRMDGYTLGWVILPDQFQVINALLILAFIPLFDIWVYPALAKVNLLKRPLQRLVTGGMLAGLAFVISGLVELKLETTNPVIPHAGQTNLNFINTLPCQVDVTLNGHNSTIISPQHNHVYEQIEAMRYKLQVQVLKSKYAVEEHSSNNSTVPMEEFFCNAFVDGMYIVDQVKQFDIDGVEEKAKSILIVLGQNKTLQIVTPNVVDELQKKEGLSKLKVFQYGFDPSWQNVTVEIKPTEAYRGYNPYEFNLDRNGTDQYSSLENAVEPIAYYVVLKYSTSKQHRINLGKVELATGGNYILSVAKNYSHVNGGANHDKPFAIGLQTVTRPNSVHILWLLPQYIIITVGEIMFSITGLSFSYAEAPESMKSVVQAAWLLTIAFGNLIVVAVVKLKFFEKQSNTVFLFSALMFLDMLIFIVMAYFYKPRNSNSDSSTPEGDKPEDGNDNDDGFTMNKGFTNGNSNGAEMGVRHGTENDAFEEQAL